MSHTRITGIILAGGKSSRMGTDKSLIEFKGKPLIQHAIDSIKPLCDQVIISSNHNRYGFTGCESWPDSMEGNAPMIGIYSCLDRSSSEVNIVHTCDMPLLSTQFFQYLIRYVPNFDVVVPLHHNALIEPLCGIYRKNVTGMMELYIRKKNFRLHEFISNSKHCKIEIHEAMEFYREGMFSNINTMDDLARISALL
jgi:molybdenum cofactor guanylyltransferase